MRRALLAALTLAALAAGLARAADPAPAADPDDIKLVRLFLKTPTADLPQEAIPHFLAIDPDTLPKSLRERFLGKRLELYSLKQIADNKPKGMIRSPAPECDVVQQAKSQDLAALRLAGYEEITADDERCLMKFTHCTERGLMCEFSLQVVDEHRKKGPTLRHYFLFPNDPMQSVLVTCRPGYTPDNNFFSAMKPSCTE